MTPFQFPGHTDSPDRSPVLTITPASSSRADGPTALVRVDTAHTSGDPGATPVCLSGEHTIGAAVALLEALLAGYRPAPLAPSEALRLLCCLQQLDTVTIDLRDELLAVAVDRPSPE